MVYHDFGTLNKVIAVYFKDLHAQNMFHVHIYLHA